MSLVRFTATVLVIIALLSPTLAAGGFQTFGFGNQARGMGGAFRAVADDWTAAYYNPAGYARINDNQLGANTSLIHLRNELIPDYRFGDIYEVGILNDQVNYNKHQIYSNPSGGFVARVPLFGESVIGLSAYQPFDNNITWTLYEMPLAYNDTLSLPTDQYSNNLDVVAFQLTFARDLVEEKVAFGLGLQLLRADLKFSSIVFRNNPYEGTVLADRPWDKVTEYNQNDGNGWGFGINAGLMIKLNDKANLGITASVPFDITLKGDSKLDFFMPKINSLTEPGSTDGEDYTQGTPEYLFIVGNEIIDQASFETTLKLPVSFGAGLAYDVTDKLLLALDAEYTLWSAFEGFDFTFTDHNGLTGAADTSAFVNEFFTADLSYPVEWKDAAKVMLGARYLFSNSLTLLAGTSFDQSPAREAAEFTPMFVDTGDKTSISGGAVYHYGQWDFGISGAYTAYSDITVSELVDTNDDGLIDSFTGQYKANTYETVLSFNYRF